MSFWKRFDDFQSNKDYYQQYILASMYPYKIDYKYLYGICIFFVPKNKTLSCKDCDIGVFFFYYFDHPEECGMIEGLKKAVNTGLVHGSDAIVLFTPMHDYYVVEKNQIKSKSEGENLLFINDCFFYKGDFDGNYYFVVEFIKSAMKSYFIDAASFEDFFNGMFAFDASNIHKVSNLIKSVFAEEPIHEWDVYDFGV